MLDAAHAGLRRAVCVVPQRQGETHSWHAASAAGGSPMSATVSFGEALKFWLKLGFISFGGPAGQIAIMHRELVEQKRWISERRFLHALNYCMLLPGPEAQQLATYIGWLMHRTWGGIVAGALFVLPSLFILIALSWFYVAFGEVSWVAGIFYGIKPAVAAIVLQAVWRIGSRTLKSPRKVPLLWAIAVLSFVAIAVLKIPFPWVVLAAAARGRAGRQVPARAIRRGRRPCGGPASMARRRTVPATSSTTPRPRPRTRYSASRGWQRSCSWGPCCGCCRWPC